MVTLEAILERNNLNRAYKQVKANRGGPGVDGMTVDEPLDYLRAHAVEIVETVKAGKYKPQPVRRVMIPKEEKGKFRPLGIPTAVDRVIQQAIAQKLSDEYEPVFSLHSHGFRPCRSCRTAIDEALDIANQGYVWVVDLDLSKFFDTVNHSKLLQLLSDKLKDGRVVSLIHKILRAPIQEGDKIMPCEIGTPQGGPVSPVLANIMLNELDHELERRGHRFVRYADDMMIFCRSRKAAERTLRHQALRGGKAVSETQRTEDEDLPHDGSEPEVPWVWLLAKPRHRESTTASEVQGQMQTAPEGHYLTQSRQKP